MPFSTYLKYAASTFDEMPLYLFDKTFIDHAPQLAKDFRVPRVFSEDLMQVSVLVFVSEKESVCMAPAQLCMLHAPFA